MWRLLSFSLVVFCLELQSLFGKVELGVDRLFSPQYLPFVEGKRVGLVTNRTGVTSSLESTFSLFEKKSAEGVFTFVALFSPEHGLYGADTKETCVRTDKGILVYSLHDGRVPKRISKEMAKDVDVLVFDIQDIGCRSYTFISALFYVMEDAAKLHIPLVVLDRPNPLGGLLVDGPMLAKEYRSYVGYVNVPYCHGMTVGELAQLFCEEYNIGCQLTVVPMRGWTRKMRFEDTKLSWVPTSPNIPEATGAFFYPTTGLIGELGVVSTGVWTPLPFRLIVAPWIKGKEFVSLLQRPGPEGVYFQEIHLTPSFGKFKDKPCEGAVIIIKDSAKFNPIKVFYWILSTLKDAYPSRMKEAFSAIQENSLFYKACGSKRLAEVFMQNEHPYAALVHVDEQERQGFLPLRKKYLISSYGQ